MVKLVYLNKKWVKLNLRSRKGFYLHYKLKKRLDNVTMILENKFDCLILISGMERVGKSCLAITCAYYLSNGKLTINNFAIDIEDAIRKIEILSNTILIIDEGMLIFSSKDHMNRFQKKLLKILTICGQKQIILIVVAPSVLDLNRYIVCRRARFLLHCYADKNLKRGKFVYYNQKTLPKLYDEGKKYGTIPWNIHPEFRGDFVDFKPSFYDEYEKLKLETLEKSFGDKLEELKIKDLKPVYIKLLKNIPNMKKPIVWTQFAELTGLSLRTISNYRQQITPIS